MPLTTLSAHIDYAFLTMPLDNSVVSIKVWLFRNFLDKDISLGSFSFFKLIRIPYKIFLEYRMKNLLVRYKNYLIDKKKAKRSKKYWFKRHKRERFSFYKKVLDEKIIKNSLIFNIGNFKKRNWNINKRSFNIYIFFKNFYNQRNLNFLFIKNYFRHFDYVRFNFFKGLRSDNSLDFFDNYDDLYNFSDFFNWSFSKKVWKRSIVTKSVPLHNVLFSNFFFESGKLENFFLFFFSGLKIKEKNYLKFFLLNSQFLLLDHIKFYKSFNFFFYTFFFNRFSRFFHKLLKKKFSRFLNNFFPSRSSFSNFRNFWSVNKFFVFFKKKFLLKGFFFSLDKFKKNFRISLYNNYKWKLNFHFFKNFYNQRNLKLYLKKKK